MESLRHLTIEETYELSDAILKGDKNEIKKAFKRMARQYHPDVAEDKVEAERKFGEINEAYAALKDRPAPPNAR